MLKIGRLFLHRALTLHRHPGHVKEKNTPHVNEFMDTPWFLKGVSKKTGDNQLVDQKSSLIMTVL
jgi:hypothetical protein